jgi:hypothetical protein
MPRWYAGEVKPDLVGVGASKREDFELTDTSEGVCFSLSIWWIIKSARKENFWKWMVGPGEQVSDIKNLFVAQSGGRFHQADKIIRRQTRMTRQCDSVENEGAQFKYAGYYYISLRGKFASSSDESGHAIAAYLNADGKSRYFDPNFGEYETDTAEETLDDLKKLILRYGISNRKIYWCCWK